MMGPSDIIPMSPRGVMDAFHHDQRKTSSTRTIAKEDTSTSNSSRLDLTSRLNKVVGRTRSGDLRAGIKDVEKKILLVKEQSIRDKEDMQVRLRQAKTDYQHQMHESLGLSSSVPSNKEHDKTLRSIQKEIRSLKEANAKLRKEKLAHRRRIDDLQESNKQLEKSFRLAEERCAELIEHIIRLEESQKKLQTQCEMAKKQLRKMRRDYFNRRSHHKAESKCCKAYEDCLAKILAKVQQKDSNVALHKYISRSTERVWAEVFRIRTQELATRGAAVLSMPLKRCAAAWVVNATGAGSDDDSEDTTTSDDSDTDSESWDSDSSSSSSDDDFDGCKFKWGNDIDEDSSSSSYSDDEDQLF
jgi:chromosome segregation ATPase